MLSQEDLTLELWCYPENIQEPQRGAGSYSFIVKTDDAFETRVGLFARGMDERCRLGY